MNCPTPTAAITRESTSRSLLQRFVLISLAIAALSLPHTAPAVTPAPDGGYPNANTAEGTNALFSLTNGSSNTAIGFNTLNKDTIGGFNTAVGASALFNTADGRSNCALGSQALLNNTTGSFNTAAGGSALINNTIGQSNTAYGFFALMNTTDGKFNVAVGNSALGNNTNGSSNIALGVNAGNNLTSGSNNIYIGSPGVATESDSIHVGAFSSQTHTYVQGIYNQVAASGLQVFVAPNGRLGTMLSSARYKEAISPMDRASEAILALRPVTFRYKHQLDPDGIPQFGLVAEEVEKINPDLVARDADGKVNSVRYEAVNAMLLNEFLKEHRKVEEQNRTLEEQQSTIRQVKATVAEDRATIAKQQKQIDTLTAGFQKVSGQLELNKAAPRLVGNPQ